MPCGCHKTMPRKEADSEPPKTVEGRVRPFDQCAACAQKHLATALVLMREHSYETENRMSILGNLRAVVDHTSRRWKRVADLARECAHAVQRYEDGPELQERLRTLSSLLEDALFEDAPEIAERARALRESAASEEADGERHI